MNAPLYTPEILRLAASLAEPRALDRVDGRAELRSPTCGSTVATEVMIDDGKIAALSQTVSACAFGQAAAALGRTVGHRPRSRRHRTGARPTSSDWLAGRRDDPGGWPGLDALAPARAKTGRHGAILLPFRALLAAMERRLMASTPAEVAETTTAILESGAIMLGAALVFVTLFRKLKLGATLGYIVAGALIGPHVLGLIQDPENTLGITEIGIALLLFIVGLELQPSRLWRLRKDIFGLGLAQVVLCGIAIVGASSTSRSASSPAASLAIGLPLALSSTAQVLPMLRSADALNTPQGERAFSILLLQDLAIVPMITIIAAMSRAPPDPDAAERLDAGALHLARGRRAGRRRAAGPQPLVPADRAASASANCSSSPGCSP